METAAHLQRCSRTEYPAGRIDQKKIGVAEFEGVDRSVDVGRSARTASDPANDIRGRVPIGFEIRRLAAGKTECLKAVEEIRPSLVVRSCPANDVVDAPAESHVCLQIPLQPGRGNAGLGVTDGDMQQRCKQRQSA